MRQAVLLLTRQLLKISANLTFIILASFVFKLHLIGSFFLVGATPYQEVCLYIKKNKLYLEI